MISGNQLEKLFMNIEEVHKNGFVFQGIFMGGEFVITTTEAIREDQENVTKQE